MPKTPIPTRRPCSHNLRCPAFSYCGFLSSFVVFSHFSQLLFTPLFHLLIFQSELIIFLSQFLVSISLYSRSSLFLSASFFFSYFSRNSSSFFFSSFTRFSFGNSPNPITAGDAFTSLSEGGRKQPSHSSSLLLGQYPSKFSSKPFRSNQLLCLLVEALLEIIKKLTG